MGWNLLIQVLELRAVDDPSLSQLSTAGVIFVVLLFVGVTAAVAIPIWRRGKRRREHEARIRRQASLSARAPEPSQDEEGG